MSDLILKKVKNTIRKNNMLENGDKIIVGVSGGPDSVALLHLLYNLKNEYELNLFVVHINHMFRGEQAKREAEYVADLAKARGLEYEIFERDVPSLINKEGLSPQDAGHRVRVEIFNEVKKKIKATKLALGHHADDRAETVLLHLIQGTGIDGLASMPPQNGWIIRPLAFLSKDEIERYCQEQNLFYWVDYSNAKPVYLRNKIRLKLLPLLKESYNPQMVEALGKLEDIAWVENEYINIITDKIFTETIKEENNNKVILNIDKLKSQHLAIQRRLIRRAYRELKPMEQNLSYLHVENIIELSNKKAGNKELILPEGIIVKKMYHTIQFVKYSGKIEKNKEEFSYELKIPGFLKLREQKILLSTEIVKDCMVETGLNKIAIDLDKIKKSLVVRNRKPGDRIQPLGMEGTKKIKEIMIEHKIDREKRNLLPLICSGDDIIWLPEIIMNERYKVTSRTKKCLVLKLERYE